MNKLHQFCNTLTKNKETDIQNPAAIAEEFCKYFGLFPTELYQPGYIRSLCHSLGLEIVQQQMPNGLRGFHEIYDGKITIILPDYEWPGGIRHTVMHEIFEIVANTINRKDLITEKNANTFSANVLMPEEAFFDFAIRANFDLERIKDKFPQSSLSIMIRLKEILASKGYSYFGLISTNQNYHKPHNIDNFGVNEGDYVIANSTGIHEKLVAIDAGNLMNDYTEECLRHECRIVRSKGGLYFCVNPIIYESLGIKKLSRVLFSCLIEDEKQRLIRNISDFISCPSILKDISKSLG